MQTKKTYEHPDSVSGMTLMDDGNWYLWSEGYSPINAITMDDGCVHMHRRIQPHCDEYNEIVEALNDPPEDIVPMDDSAVILFYLVRGMKLL